MRKADRTETKQWHGRDVEVKVWNDESDIPFEDWEIDHYESKGVNIEQVSRWDIGLEVTLRLYGHEFEGYSSMCAVDADSNDVEALLLDMYAQACDDLKGNLQDIAKSSEVVGRFSCTVLDVTHSNGKAHLLLGVPEKLQGLKLRWVKLQDIPFVNVTDDQHCFTLGACVVHANSTPQEQFYTHLVDGFLDGNIERIHELKGKILDTQWHYHSKWGFTFPGFSIKDEPSFN